METNVRNHLLAKAVGKFGLKAVAARLCISENLLRLYVSGRVLVPDEIWLLAVEEKAGLISEVISQPIAPYIPESKDDLTLRPPAPK